MVKIEITFFFGGGGGGVETKKTSFFPQKNAPQNTHPQ